MPPAADADIRRAGPPARRLVDQRRGGVIEPLDPGDAARAGAEQRACDGAVVARRRSPGRAGGRAFLARRIGASRPSCSPSTRTPTTTAPTSCGSANATALRLCRPHRRRAGRADAAMPAGCTTTFRTLFAGHERRLRGQPSRPIPRRMPSMRAGLREVGPPRSTAAPRPSLSQARAFRRSRISVSSSCSLVGGAGGGGAACSLLNRRFMPLITRNSTKAMMMKFTVTVMNWP